MTTRKPIIDLPDKDLETLLEIITGAAALGHALALLKPQFRSHTTLHLLGQLAEMRKQGETTESFIVQIAIETCADTAYPERLVHFLLANAHIGEAANED